MIKTTSKWYPKKSWTLLICLTLSIQGCLLNQNNLNRDFTTAEAIDRIKLRLSGWPKSKEPITISQNNEGVVRVVEIYNDLVRNRLAVAFHAAGVTYPPSRLALLAFRVSSKSLRRDHGLTLW